MFFLGPDHIGVFVSPKPKVKLSGWSFTDFIPENPPLWNDRPAYFILYGYGIKPDKPYTFWFDTKVSPGYDADVQLDIVINGQFIHHKNSRTKDYDEFLSQFPSWTHPVAWYTQYQSWVY